MILLLGGAHSGKSAFASALAAALERRDSRHEGVLYLAPIAEQVVSAELQRAMEAQRSLRPSAWRFEEPPYSPEDFESLVQLHSIGTVIFDGLNLWLGYEITNKSSIYDAKTLERHCRKELMHLVEILANLKARTIVTSGVVNEGLPPSHESGRLLRELLGRATQTLASHAEVVCKLESGIATTLKLPKAWLPVSTPQGWTPVWNVEAEALAESVINGRMQFS